MSKLFNYNASRLQVVKNHFIRVFLTRARSDDASSVGGHPLNKKYQYTLDNSFLSDEQRDFYEENGYLVVTKLISLDDVKSYHDRFLDICYGRVEKDPLIFLMKDVALRKVKDIPPEKVITKMTGFINDPILSQYSRLPQILKYVECFTGNNIDVFSLMLMNKAPDPGSKSTRHPFHQDGIYFPFEPVNRIVGSWTAMEKVTRENGCLVVMPGSHKRPLLRHSYPQWEGEVNMLYHGIMDLDLDQHKVYLHMEEGDTVFFHPFLIHGSGSNRTQGFRRGISAHFKSSFSEYIDVKGTLLEDITKDFIAAAEKIFPGVQLTLQKFWELRSATVQRSGEERKL